MVLSQLKNWFVIDSMNMWKDIEASQIPAQDLKTWILSSPKLKLNDKTLSPTIAAMVKASNHFISYIPTKDKSHQIPIPEFSLLIPDLPTCSWQKASILQVADLYSGCLLKPFPTLQKNVLLANADYFKFIQITHCLLNKPPGLYT